MHKKLENTKAFEKLVRIGLSPHHGVATPLFSIYSETSGGIGEYLDLIPFIDFLKSISFDVLQLLPLNDTGDDPSPYNLLSTKALHPIYLKISNLPRIEKHPDLFEEAYNLKDFLKQPRVPYHAILKAKEAITREYFKREEGYIKELEGFSKFVESNPWVSDYALFKGLKSFFSGKDSREWESSPPISASEINYQIAIQFFCSSQFLAVKAYANANGIFIMGDLPILVSHDSADVYFNPNLFDKKLIAGAPPDQYSKEGQVWGFPIYNLKALKKDHYQFWQERLKKAENYYHIYRIDHIVGLFRIFAIPENEQASNGFFLPENHQEWIPRGKEILEMFLDSSDMLPIGEDLGSVPTSVRTTMKSLGIAGTKVIRWEKQWDRHGNYPTGAPPFIPLENYPIDSLTTVSTHDSSPLFLWIKKEPLELDEFLKFMGWQQSELSEKEIIYKILSASHHTPSLFHVNLLQEYLSLIEDLESPQKDLERINTPGTVSPLNWSLRYNFSLEELLKQDELKTLMKSMTE